MAENYEWEKPASFRTQFDYLGSENACRFLQACLNSFDKLHDIDRKMLKNFS
jgi:hypothetical protein